jgi:hypothetical protein
MNTSIDGVPIEKFLTSKMTVLKIRHTSIIYTIKTQQHP